MLHGRLFMLVKVVTFSRGKKRYQLVISHGIFQRKRNGTTNSVVKFVKLHLAKFDSVKLHSSTSKFRNLKQLNFHNVLAQFFPQSLVVPIVFSY